MTRSRTGAAGLTRLCWPCIGSLMIVVALLASAAEAETFTFGFDANNLNGTPSTTLTAGAFSMDLAAGPAGSGLWETNSIFGMGVDSEAVLGPGGLPARFDRINGTSEYIEFSFGQSGILTGLNFDGVKDESLEYFLLESTGVHVNFFDSFANTTIPGAVDNALLQGAITGGVVYLLENGTYDDETIDLAIPFVAGQIFRLSYQEVGGGLGAQYEPTIAPNGARLQGISVVPEPGAWKLFAVGALLFAWVTLTRRRFTAR
ncbi:MAG: hypothetical protein AB7O59_08595 [Pirellulales bacterium]